MASQMRIVQEYKSNPLKALEDMEGFLRRAFFANVQIPPVFLLHPKRIPDFYDSNNTLLCNDQLLVSISPWYCDLYAEFRSIYNLCHSIRLLLYDPVLILYINTKPDSL